MGKNQHYIPRFLLRYFSEDIAKKSLTTYHIKNKSIILNASIKNQASKDFIYGKDQTIETILQNIETAAANTVSKLLRNQELSYTEKDALRIFIHFQLNRTPFNAENNNEMANLVFKSMYNNHPTIGKIIDDTTVELKNPFLLSILLSIETSGLLSDLSINILENNSKIPFILGQRPAFIINPFLYEKNIKFFSQGIAVKGICILLPVSFGKVIILYDKWCYKLIKKSDKLELSIDDINKINEYQFCYTSDCVYIKKCMDIDYLDTLSEVTQDFRVKNILEIQPVKYQGQRILYEQTKIPKINPSISILKTRNQAYCEHLVPTKECLVRESIIPEVLKIENDNE